MANDIIIYTADYCPYCTRAKTFLEMKGQKFKEIDVTNDQNLREEMKQKSNGRSTIPQIFVNGEHIGGHDDMMGLNASGELDKILGIAS